MARELAQALGPMLADIRTLAMNSAPRQNMVDSRGMGKPPSFNGAEKGWREWKGKLTAYLCASGDANTEETLKWAESKSIAITQEALQGLCLDERGQYSEQLYQVWETFGRKLYLILVDTCKDEPYRIVESAGNGQGFEAWRLLHRRYNSRTPGTKRALLQSLFSLKPATTIDAFESLLLTIEEMVRRYDGMAESVMSEDIRCAILVACCPKDLKDFLDMSSEEFVYTDLRNKINTYVERKRDHYSKGLSQMEHRQGGGPAPMDVGATYWEHDAWQDDPVQNWGGYSTTHTSEPQWWDSQFMPDELSYVKGAYKGGAKAKGKGKSSGKSSHSSLVGSRPSYSSVTSGKPSFSSLGGKSAGKGAGKKGKGKGKGCYNGECHWCGRWGHTAKFCRDKDAFMTAQRQQWATGNVEEFEPEPAQDELSSQPVHSSSLAGLEAASVGTYRDMTAHFELGALLKANRYAAFMDDEAETDMSRCVPRPMAPSSCAPGQKAPTRQWRARQTPPLPSIPEAALDVLNLESSPVKHIDLTIDSGAAEHVVGPSVLPHVPVTDSSAKGVEYVMANGKRIPNSGEQHIRATTAQGQTCSFTAQVTAVHKPLMSVSRICDGGHRVVFESGGGYIENLDSGSRIDIRRENNVYRLQVAVPRTGFHRQGS